MSRVGSRLAQPVEVERSMHLTVSQAQHLQRRPHATGVRRRAVAFLVSLTWIASSLICPVPALAHEADHPSAPASHGHEHHHTHGDSHSNNQSDLCCDILGQLYVAADSLNKPLYLPSAPDHAPLPIEGFVLVAAAATGEAASLLLHGPEPPRRSWPQFTKVWSQAPPADRR